MLMISKALLMLSGRLSMISCRKFMMLEHRSYSLNCPLEIWLLSGLLIEAFSVQAESLSKIYIALLKQPELLSKPQLTTSPQMCWELAVALKSVRSVQKGTTSSKNAQT